MWNREVPDLNKYFNLPNPGLHAYLDHVEAGNQEIYRPPFWKKRDPQSVVKDWLAVLKASNVKSQWPSLYSYEEEMASKVGPMSYQRPLKERLASVENYYTMVELHSEAIRASAVEEALDYFGSRHSIRPRSVAETIANMRTDTNSGAPNFRKRANEVDTVLRALSQPTQIDWRYMGIKDPGQLPAVLGFRGQEGGPSVKDTKNRDVWMFPFVYNVMELQVYQPLIQSFQTSGVVPAWVSMDAVDKGVTATWKWKAPEDVVICTDFSKFDHHFNADLQNTARYMLSELLQPSEFSSDWLESVFPQKYTVPLVCSEKIMFTGFHGMGSGSGGTNADETLTHKSMQYEAAADVGTELCPYSQCLGDDGYVCGSGLTVDSVTRSYSRHGQEMNPSKQYASNSDLIYLRRWHSQDYVQHGVMVGVYPTCRALGRLLYQERFYDPDIWNSKMVELRAWSILENCNKHPCFEEFVDYVMKGDKYRLGLGIPGFLENVGRLSKEAIELMPDFLGYTKSLQEKKGITDWRIYKYLKSKASA